MYVADKEIIGIWKRTDTGVRYEFGKIRVIIGTGEEAEVLDYSIRPGVRSDLVLNGTAFTILSMSRFSLRDSYWLWKHRVST